MLNLIRVDTPNIDQIDNVQLDNTTVLWLSDVIKYDQLDQFIKKFGTPKYIFSDDNFGHHQKSIYSLPLYLEKEILLFKDLNFIEQVETKSCCNFMINKKSLNRALLLKLVEYFKVPVEYYTYSGMCKNMDMTLIIEELESLKDQSWPPMTNEEYEYFRFQLLSPCDFPPNIIKYDKQHIIENCYIGNYGGIKWTWTNGLDKIFQNSAVSLISESIEFQKVSCVTEKTGYSVLGLTFPIWVGGYGIPDAWKNAGFDIFSDIIDHSYQYKNTLIERCYHAFADNIKLLSDINFVQKKRNDCLIRLIDNRKKLLNGSLTDYCTQTSQTWPEDLYTVIKPLL